LKKGLGTDVALQHLVADAQPPSVGGVFQDVFPDQLFSGLLREYGLGEQIRIIVGAQDIAESLAFGKNAPLQLSLRDLGTGDLGDHRFFAKTQVLLDAPEREGDAD
jgi:hypothetical protein